MYDEDIGGPYAPPERTRATRMFPARSRASARGFLVAKLRAQAAWRQLIFESHLERKCLLVLLSQHAVVDVWDQPPQITYRNQDGKLKPHTFDFLATLDDGKRIAIAVKPDRLVERNGFDREFTLIKAQTAKQFADDLLLVTDSSFSAAEVRNAELLHMFRQVEDAEADAAVQQVFRGMNCEMSLGQVVAATGLQGRAFRAGFKAIFDGIVMTNLSFPVTEASMLSMPQVH
ncbi:Tn7 transposase TnsA N-terminal domain-containing protein [Leisingera sp. MMG026]|uniref:Tn7 transposase TnsA N-terminal domain-containing protein n=1 Tax=Leisingera sp. MMG026 TaxID=2909982 RepID=UPI001F3EB134|nr:Tn7 transposase TnsA N-terminal domain-containing protein [Leisingera sp. MMG026]MCF6433798.1 Tn7 transposase TnsA N-terminal domain-containing protein [Leisingera sp. MMG026]